MEKNNQNQVEQPELLARLSKIEAELLEFHKAASETYVKVPESRYYITSMMNISGFLKDKFTAHLLPARTVTGLPPKPKPKTIEKADDEPCN